MGCPAIFERSMASFQTTPKYFLIEPVDPVATPFRLDLGEEERAARAAMVAGSSSPPPRHSSIGDCPVRAV